MRNYILTKKERNILQNWLKNGEEQPGYHTLKTRITHNFFPLSEDIKLLTKYLIQIEGNLPAKAREKTNNIKTWVLEYMKEAAPDKIPEVRSITERLNGHTRLLVAALENSLEAIIILDKYFRILYVNDALTQISGRSRLEFSGQIISDFYNGFDYSEYKARLQAEGRLTGETQVMLTGGGEKVGWVEFNASAIQHEDEVLAYTVSIKDISDRKKMERELSALLRKLGNQ